MSYALPSITRVPAAEKGLTIADFLVPVRVGERVSPRLRNVALVVAGSLLIYLTAQVVVPDPRQPGPDHAPELRRAGRRRLARPAPGRPGRVPVRGAGGRRAPVLRRAQGRHQRDPRSTGGYLVGFVLAGALVGRLAELGWDRRISARSAQPSATL